MRKILFIDDDTDVRCMIEMKLSEEGYEVFLAANASEAMKLQHDVKLDLIILDLDLGGEDGRQLMKFLKRNNPGVRIILYTGEDHENSVVAKMMQEGAFRYIMKGSDENGG